MRKYFTLVNLAALLVLLVTSCLALYYRDQAVFFQRQYTAAAARIDQMAAAMRHDFMQAPAAPGAGGAGDLPPSRADLQTGIARPAAGKSNDAAIAITAVPAREPAPPRERRRSPQDWMGNLDTNDQRYAQFQQRRQAMQENLQNAWMQATNYFMNRDLSKMPQKDREEYTAMLTLLSQAASLNQQLQSGLPPDLRQQVVSDLHSNIVAVTPLLINERNREYFDAAVAMGQSEQDAAAMVNYINQITSNTSLHAIIPGVRMGGWRGRAP